MTHPFDLLPVPTVVRVSQATVAGLALVLGAIGGYLASRDRQRGAQRELERLYSFHRQDDLCR